MSRTLTYDTAPATRDLAARLRLVRVELFGDGVPELAEALGLPEQTWANYEAGVAIPGAVLLAFLVATSAEPRWLMDGTGPRYRPDRTRPSPAPYG